MSFAQNPSNVSKSFLSVAKKFDKDRGSLDDANEFFSCNGYGVSQNHPEIFTICLSLPAWSEMGEVSI